MLEEETQKLELGSFLRYQREQRGISLEQIASSTKINLKILQQLETNQFDLLPAKPFLRGFVINYCKHIGISYEDVLTKYDAYLDEKTMRTARLSENSPHIFVDKESNTDTSKTGLKIAMVSFALIGLVAFAIVKPTFKHRKHKDRSALSNEELVTVLPPTLIELPKSTEVKIEVKSEPVKEIKAVESIISKPENKPESMPSPSEIAKNEPKAEPKVVAKLDPKPEEKAKPETKTEVKTEAEAQPTPDPKSDVKAKPETKTELNKEYIPPSELKHFLVVTATEDSWVKYQADDFKVRAFTLRVGQKVFIKCRNTIRFYTGNPKGIQVSNDNRNFKPYESNSKIYVLPKDREAEFQTNPFNEKSGSP